MSSIIHPTAVIDSGAIIGENTSVWHFTHIMSGAVVGDNCSIGQNVFIAANVRIGSGVKIQNNVSLYEGVVCEDDVFLGPSCVFTNIRNPRSPISRKHLYEPTVIARGATIGANATIICGNRIGEYSLIGAGAVITRSVPAYALMTGNPARQSGWVSRCGHRLGFDEKNEAVCPESGERYVLVGEGELKIEN
jgi:UDP-2-acetamido-3-amino-2,3-dideoxy-glucuronate N-acetyltransferase